MLVPPPRRMSPLSQGFSRVIGRIVLWAESRADVSPRAITAAALSCVVLFATLSPAAAVVRSTDTVDGERFKDAGVVQAAMPDVTMKAGALITSDGRVLWARSADQKRSMASLTKIMTAVVALEEAGPDAEVRVSRNSLTVGESTSFLREGETLPMSEAIEALLVKSGNDAAVAIAESVAGSEDDFVKLMNAKAKDLGLASTRFQNSHGLDESGHSSTAADLGILARYAMTKPEIRNAVSEKTATIGKGARAEKVENTNLLLGNYRGANGVKTGWTDEAGYCVIDSAERDGIELYAVVLGTSGELQRFRDARELLDWGFAHYRNRQLASAGTVIGEAPVTDYLDLAVPASVSESSSVPVFDLDGEIVRTVRMSEVEAPVAKGQKVGVATFTQDGAVIATIPLAAVREIPDPSPLQRIGIAFMRVWRAFTGSGVATAAMMAGVS